MGKRSNFVRRERDFYPTPVEAVKPLIHHLPYRFTYIEPCSGDGALVRAIGSFEGVSKGGSFCPILEYASDIHLPWQVTSLKDDEKFNCNNALHAYQRDVFDIESVEEHVDFFITNPPWNRDILHPLINHLSSIRPTWLLFDADWMHTKQAQPYLSRCTKIISVGRVKWIKDSKYTGKDNCCWYFFEDVPEHSGPQVSVDFYGRFV
tara:strand:+ start:2445 stop:3062 length:618 start_codon:yes stop_codon:yes gene_type:complete